jgi:hypothetical protein
VKSAPFGKPCRALDSEPPHPALCSLYFSNMSKQYNKVIKRKRRAAYLKRKKVAAQKTSKSAKK